MSCMKALREAAMVEPDNDKRYMLRGAANVLQEALDRLANDPTLENMIDVNGAWAFAARCLKFITPPQDGSGGRGLREEARLAA